MSTSSSPLLSVRNLGVSFGVGGGWTPRQLRALHGVSFDLQRGEILGVVGESGSGKSTLGKLLCRLEQPTAGTFLLGGDDVLAREPRRASLGYRRRVQMVFQDPFASLNPTKTVIHHVERPLLIHGRATRANVRSKALTLLEQVGLAPAEAYAGKPPFALSGGQRQRVAIARAIAPEPELLIADEPTSMLDQSIRMDVLRLLDRLRRERGLAMVFITHDLAAARWLCDRILVMYAGQAMELAPAQQLAADPQHPYAKLLIAAAPRPGGSVFDPLPAGEGLPPTVDPPPGCPFRERCREAHDPCAVSLPTVERDGRLVRCHLHVD